MLSTGLAIPDLLKAENSIPLSRAHAVLEHHEPSTLPLKQHRPVIRQGGGVGGEAVGEAQRAALL